MSGSKKLLFYITAITLVVIIGAASTLFISTGDEPSQANITSSEHTTEENNSTPIGKKRYTHPSYLFSLLVPEEVQVESHYEEGGAETVVFSVPNTDPVLDFQLYIVPYSATTITSSQVAKDTHGRAVTEPAEVILGSGIRGIIFETEDPRLGRLREVWFLMNGHLYEATTHIDNESWLADILDTLTPNRP